MASTKWSSRSRDCHSDPYQGTLEGTKPSRVVIGHQAPDISVEERTKRSSGRTKSKEINEFEKSLEKMSLITVMFVCHVTLCDFGKAYVFDLSLVGYVHYPTLQSRGPPACLCFKICKSTQLTNHVAAFHLYRLNRLFRLHLSSTPLQRKRYQVSL